MLLLSAKLRSHTLDRYGNRRTEQMLVNRKRGAADRLTTLGFIVVPLVWLGAVSTMIYILVHFISKFW